MVHGGRQALSECRILPTPPRSVYKVWWNHPDDLSSFGGFDPAGKRWGSAWLLVQPLSIRIPKIDRGKAGDGDGHSR